MDFSFSRAFGAQGKALGPHPAFTDSSTPVSVYSPGATRKRALISQREAIRHSEAYGGRQDAIHWVYSCIGLYSDPASTSPIKLVKDGKPLYEVKDPDGALDEAEQGPKDLYELLSQPNPHMLWDELISLLLIDRFLVGNAYWLKWRIGSDGRPLSLYRLAPAYVKVVPGTFGVERYEYQPPGASKPMLISVEEMIHFKAPNPHSHYYGLGLIQAGGKTMDLDLSITDTMSSYYENKADPSLIIQSERRVSRDVFNKLRAQLRARASGSSRAGELLVLEAGLKASTLSASASDALFDKLAKMSRDNILGMFRASPMLFGSVNDAGGSNKISDAQRQFDNYALRPILAKLQNQISAELTAAWGVEFIFDYKTILPPEDAQKIGSEIAKVPGIKVKEVRRQYAQFGIPESTGDDLIDNFVLNMPGPEADENGVVKDPVTGETISTPTADRPLSGEAGRPPLGKNTRGFGSTAAKKKGTKSLDEVMADLDRLSVLAQDQKALNASGESVSVGSRLPGEQRPSDPFADSRKVDIDLAQDTMAMKLRGIARDLETDLIAETLGTKALKTTDIVKRLRTSKSWASFKEKLVTILEEGARQAAVSGAMHSNKAPDEELDYDALVASVVHRPDGARSILKTIKDRVINRVKEARDADAERGDYESAIRGALSDWSERQVLSIADSEATEAYNEAVLSMMELAGENQVFVVEEDDAPDDACKEASGQVWDIDYARDHRKEHPRCRRSFLSLAGEAVE